MNNDRRQQSSVLFGDSLNDSVPNFLSNKPVCTFHGVDGSGKQCVVPLNADLLSKHIMLLGGIGTGKTNAFFHMISQLQDTMADQDVMVLFDTKGDFQKEFYRPGDIIISNDSLATGETGPDYWNIFNEIDYGDRMQESIIEISKALFAEACERTNQVFFPNAARDIFMACVLFFVRNVEESKRTNANLLMFINSASAQAFRNMLMRFDDLKAMCSYISSDDSPQTQGVLSELQRVVREVFIGNFSKNGTLSLKQLVKSKGRKKIFIEYDLSVGGMLSPIYSLMFDLAIKEALGRGRSEGNVYFICDEFKLLPHLNHIDDAVNFGRSLGIKCMIGIQNIEQIYDNYGEERARSILSGFSTNFCFRVNDAESRSYIQGLFGKNQKLETYLPKLQRNGIVETQREANVVEDWDIMHLKTGEAIIGIPECEPFKFRFSKY